MEQLLAFGPTANSHTYGYGCGVVSLYPNYAREKNPSGIQAEDLYRNMTYMIYLPVHEVSFLVIINDWNNDFIDSIKDAFIRIVLENHG